ncbi:MAG: hypothetical protein K1X61_08910 [Chitinophagales bacterium]|nr:hypothetical protein [Chitinophagales bacterium]
MKSTSVKITLFAVAISGLLTMHATAQTTQTKAPASAASTEAKKTESKDAKKQEFTKHLNEIQPKVQDYTAKAASEKNAEFSNEAAKLNSMVNDFKTRLDRYDSTPAAQHEQYVQAMTKDWEAINVQHKKVEGMYNKLHANKPEKAAPKEAASPK